MAAAAPIFKESDPLRLDRELIRGGTHMLSVKGRAILDRPGREVAVLPRRQVPDLVHARVPPMGLGDIEAHPVVDREAHDVDRLGLGGEELDLEPRRDAQLLDGLLRL